MKYLYTFLVCACVLSPFAVEAKGDIVKQAFGMNIHLRQRVLESDWDTAMNAATDAGVQWGREEFLWDVIEPIDGIYTWGAYDAVVDEYEEHGISMLGLLTYSSSWASSNAGSEDSEFYPPDSDAWADYVESVATRYAGRVNHWEIWNEPNHDGFWKGTRDEYVELLSTAAGIIHAVNPDAKVVLGGLSGSDTDFLEYVLDFDVGVDIVAIHPYRVVGENFNYAPESTTDGLNTLATDLYNVKATLAATNHDGIPIWLTEVGWTTGDDGVSEETQARYLMRLYSIALSVSQVKKVFWYALNDTSSNEAYNESQFGILEDTYSEKTAAAAYRFAKKHLDRRWFKDQFLPEQKTFDDFSTNQGWQFSGTECTEGSVSIVDAMLHVAYDFTRSTNCYAPVAVGKQMPEDTRALQFRLKGNDDNTLLRVRVRDATGETFQYNVGYMPREWLHYTLQLHAFANHWGGDDDGKLDGVLTFDSFVLDDTDGSYANGAVDIDDIATSTVKNAFLYRYHKKYKDIYAYWSVASSSVSQLQLFGAGRVRVKRFQNESLLKESGSALYDIRAGTFVKFLQTL